MKMTKARTVLVAVFLLLALVGVASAAGHVYQNGTDGGVGTPVSVGTGGVSVLVPARPGAFRYELSFACTVATEVAWGTSSFGAANPAPTTTTGIPITANSAWGENPPSQFMVQYQASENWDREVDIISQSGSGTCWTYEATIN